MINVKGKEVYFDPRDYRRGQFGAILAENSIAPWEERITPRKQKVDVLGSLWDWDKENKAWMRAPLKIKNEATGYEADVSYLVQRLAGDGHRYILWMSPIGGPMKYPESRMVVYEVEKVAGDEVHLNYWAICGDRDKEWCLNVAQGLLIDGGRVRGSEMRKAEEVRCYPIGLNYRGENIWEYLSQFMGDLGAVGRVLSNGDERVIFEEKLEIAAMVERRFAGRLGQSTMDDYQALRLAVEVQHFVEGLGIRLAVGGNHGASPVAASRQGDTALGVHYTKSSQTMDKNMLAKNQVVTKDTPGAKQCKKCGAYYLGDECPFC